VEIGTTDTSELHSVKTLLDSGATRSFIDRDFVHSKGINTWTLSHNIPVFNVNSSSNEARQISEVINILLHYKTHSKRMLLAASGLGKQSLILGYNWLKNHNSKINWEKGEVKMTCCPLQCEEGCTVTPLENFLWKYSMGYTLYPWISLLEPTLETSYKPQT